MGTVTVTVTIGVDTVVDVGTTVVTDVTGLVTAPTVLAAADVAGDGTVSRCCSAAAGALPAETGSFVGALRSAPWPLTPGRE